MASMTDDDLATFFSRTRQGILLTTAPDGGPDGVPIWFDWDGSEVRFFSGSAAPKMDRIRADPRIAVLVTNDLDEPPAWVRFEGRAVIDPSADAKTLAIDVLAPRYWDLDQPGYAAVVSAWADGPPDALTMVRLTPDRIRSSGS